MKGTYLSMSDAEKLANYDKLESELYQTKSQRDYWKQEYETLKKIQKEREKNYRVTNAEKTKRILELEAKVKSYEENKQMTIFDYEEEGS